MTTETPTKSESITAPDMVAEKLPQTVEIKDVGPCKKHVKVSIEEAAVRARFEEKYSDLMVKNTGLVPGFRAGKAPRKIVEKRYKPDIEVEVRQELLMASLEQLADEQSISPLSPPELDPHSIVIPEKGPFVYEFDIEVRPEFEMPDYKNLTIRRPTHTFTEDDIKVATKRILEPWSKVEDKDGGAALDDLLTADVKISKDGKELNSLIDTRFKVDKRLALEDGISENFGEKVTGAKVGEKRTCQITLSQSLQNADLKGAVVDAELTIKKIQKVVLPEMKPSLFADLGINNADQLEEYVRVRCDRLLEYSQRQAARQQIFEKLAKNTNWDLPQDMLQRQARRTLSRRIMEMREAGMTEDQIYGRRKMLENDALRSTAEALKEHFVLQKIAEVEKLEIEDSDIEDEIANIAGRSGESYRKVKARLEREDLVEALATELLERKALDLVKETVKYDDYEFNPLYDKEGEVGIGSGSAIA